jgi:hypothetical protein
MQLCFVSVHGPRETYFVDEPRTWVSSFQKKGLTSGLAVFSKRELLPGLANSSQREVMPGLAGSQVGSFPSKGLASCSQKEFVLRWSCS